MIKILINKLQFVFKHVYLYLIHDWMILYIVSIFLNEYNIYNNFLLNVS